MQAGRQKGVQTADLDPWAEKTTGESKAKRRPKHGVSLVFLSFVFLFPFGGRGACGCFAPPQAGVGDTVSSR